MPDINTLFTHPFFIASLLLGAVAALFFILFLCQQAKTRNISRELAYTKKLHENLRAEYHSLELEYTQISVQIEAEKARAKDAQNFLEQAQEQLGLQFENLAGRIFEEKNSHFLHTSKERIQNLLSPLEKDLSQLQEKIHATHLDDTRERASLKQEICDLRDLNLRMGEEAAKLSLALKGDKKLQGNWGELVLERALESSGLRKGIEFETQGTYRDADNSLFRPDVIIRLPEGKDIIVDSKVSLVNWEKSINAETVEDQERYLKTLAGDIRNHMRGLSAKNYPELKGLHSLDFVLLFMPIETAFTAAVGHDEKLITDALNLRIVIVTPTTLLATLKTIENIWRTYQQGQNSLEIAQKAATMYDKFRLFLEDMEKIGTQLNVCQKTYERAVGKLAQGKGNLIGQAEALKGLGVQTKGQIPASLIEKHLDRSHSPETFE